MAYKSICDQYSTFPAATLLIAPPCLTAAYAIAAGEPVNISFALLSVSSSVGIALATASEAPSCRRAHERSMDTKRGSRIIQRNQLLTYLASLMVGGLAAFATKDISLQKADTKDNHSENEKAASAAAFYETPKYRTQYPRIS